MQKIAYLNNKFVNMNEAYIHIEDRGLQFSDSVYEVIVVFKSKLIDFDFHINRLKYSLSELSINYKINKNKLNLIFLKLIKKNLITNGIIYLQITRGKQSREHSYKKKLKPTIISYTQKKTFNLPFKSFKAYKAVTFPDIRWKRRDIKTTSLLANILASSYAKKKSAYEAIFFQGNRITEASHSNVWIIKKNIIYTHPSNKDILKGITRTVIKKIIYNENFILKEKYFTLKQLYKADEVFITSSGSLITPINQINKIKINNGKIGKITIKLAKLLYEFYVKQI
tara:strand:- start:723 stop:1571 length:849 start_codon:yes stop_codon:yes gene_type:complete